MTIDNDQDVIDSRDIIKRIEELSERVAPVWKRTAPDTWFCTYDGYDLWVTQPDTGIWQARLDGDCLLGNVPPYNYFNSLLDACATAEKVAGYDASDPLDTDEQAELDALVALAEAAKNVSDWQDGAMLIRESFFTDYVQEFCEDVDCGALELLTKLPEYISVKIDWEETAANLRCDYEEFEFNGETYLVRA